MENNRIVDGKIEGAVEGSAESIYFVMFCDRSHIMLEIRPVLKALIAKCLQRFDK